MANAVWGGGLASYWSTRSDVPQVQQPPKDGMRLIATAPDTARWMTEDEVLALIRKDAGFMDITDHQTPVIAVRREVAIPTLPTHKDIVENLTSWVDMDLVRQNLVSLSSFNNRYYQSETGVQSADWIYNQALNISSHRQGVTVEKFTHSWAQPSVIATIPGSSGRSDFIVIGAHQDSINGLSPMNGRAPGADDDGSGSVTLLELFRVIIEGGYYPEVEIRIQWYAAEEVGLRGSQAIAQSYAAEGAEVRAMMQIDMDGYYEGEEVVAIVTDYTSSELNAWIRTLVETYLTIPWRDTVCGYGCSDHASFTAAGYPASFPFEADFSDISPYIHTAQDTVETVDFDHVSHWVKLAIAFAVETSFDD